MGISIETPRILTLLVHPEEARMKVIALQQLGECVIYFFLGQGCTSVIPDEEMDLNTRSWEVTMTIRKYDVLIDTSVNSYAENELIITLQE
jgi:hypothetical protein